MLYDMKKIIFCLFLAIPLYALPQSETAPVDTRAEQSMKNCVAHIHVGIDYLSKQKPYDFTSFVDTLYDDLYAHPVNVSFIVKYLSRVTLQSYFLETNDKRADYADIRKLVVAAAKIKGLHDMYYVSCVNGLAVHCVQTEYYADAVTAFRLQISALHDLTQNHATPMEADADRAISDIYVTKLRQYNKAVPYEEDLLRLYDELMGKESDMHFTQLKSLANIYNMAGLYPKSDSCLNIYRQHLIAHGAQPGETEEVLMSMADNFVSLGETDKEINCYREALSLSIDDTTRIDLLTHIATAYYGMGNDAKCAEYVDSALDVYEKSHFTDIDMLYGITTMCLSANSGPAIQRISRLCNNTRTDGDVESLSQSSYIHLVCGDFDKGMKELDRAKKLMKEHIADGQVGDNELQALTNALGRFGDFDEEAYFQKAYLQQAKKTVDSHHPIIVGIYDILASTYLLAGDIKNASATVSEALGLAVPGTPGYAHLIRTKGDCLMAKGDFIGAADLYRSSLSESLNPRELFNLYESIFGAFTSEYDIRANNRDSRTGASSMKDSMSVYAHRMFSLAAGTMGEHSEQYVVALQCLASANYAAGNVNEMKSDASKCERAIRQYVTNASLRRTYLQSLAVYSLFARDYAKVIALMDEKNLKYDAAGTASLYNYMMLADAYLNLKDMKKAQYYYRLQNTDIAHKIEKDFLFLTEQERTNYWNVYKQQLYDAGKFADTFGKPSAFAGDIYDIALFSKGLLLNSSVALTRLLTQAGDTAAISQLHRLQQLRSAVSSNNELPPQSRDKYTAEADNIEQHLISTSGEYGNFMNYLKCDWRQLKSCLKPGDIAIEFINYFTSDSVGRYAAVMLRPEWQCPVIIQLYRQTTFEAQVADLAINAANGKLVWEPLMPYLKDVKNIYFSPTGILHKLPVEYLPYGDTGFISDKYNIYRLSSTRLLASKRHSETMKRAAVYGGLEYAADAKMLCSQHIAPTGVADRYEHADATRMGVSYLSGSLIEADSVRDALSGKGIAVDFVTDTLGTEDRFKALSGSGVNIIHIATHGFYTKLDSIGALRSFARLQTVRQQQDNSMLESGLFFAGVDNTLNGTPLPPNINDGILTAKEISLMDLHAASLVVLSACVTAQGDVRGDGVFGIQRGFKLAGANSLVMSSWPVSDKATQMLMTAFYHNLANGIPRQRSFLQAVRTVRSHDSNYRDWAPFIILDALDEP